MGYWGGWGYDWAPRPTVAERKKSAAKEIAALAKKGRTVSPVVIEGRTIAHTFWGKAWCQNLERYSDISNRLERGRSYVRSGSVIDLRIGPGKVEALVRGSELYEVTLTVSPVEAARYRAVIALCAGKIDSVIELLQGKLSGAVMEVITCKEKGLFPAPKQIGMRCSCPDFATMCKHVAAVLYGIGARFDAEPELLFRLRGADPGELVSSAAAGTLAGARAVAKDKTLAGDLGDVFGIDLDLDPGPSAEKVSAKPVPVKKAAAKPIAVEQASVKPKAKPVAGKPKPTAKRVARQRRTEAPPVTITALALSRLGVPPSTVHSWIRAGVLERTEAHGVYVRTKELEERLMRRLLPRTRA